MDPTSGQSASHIHANFNARAQKVIRLSELRVKAAALRQSSLSPAEKLLLNAVEKPVSIIAGVVLALKLAVNQNMKIAFWEAADDNSFGFYKDTETRETYVNTGILPLAAAADRNFSLTPRLRKKLQLLEMAAVAECEDFSALRAAGRLKPG